MPDPVLSSYTTHALQGCRSTVCVIFGVDLASSRPARVVCNISKFSGLGSSVYPTYQHQSALQLAALHPLLGCTPWSLRMQSCECVASQRHQAMAASHSAATAVAPAAASGSAATPERSSASGAASDAASPHRSRQYSPTHRSASRLVTGPTGPSEYLWTLSLKPLGCFRQSLTLVALVPRPTSGTQSLCDHNCAEVVARQWQSSSDIQAPSSMGIQFSHHLTAGPYRCHKP